MTATDAANDIRKQLVHPQSLNDIVAPLLLDTIDPLDTRYRYPNVLHCHAI